MIAANYRKHPEAMARQMVLQFGRVLVWATKRPTTDAMRKVRALRGQAFKLAGRIRYPEHTPTPQWWKDAKRTAKAFADALRASQMHCA